MEGTPLQGTYTKLFEGKLENVIKCINVDYESCNQEVFNTLQLSVKDHASIEDSIRHYIKEEKLEGDNQYLTDDHGR